MTGISVSAFRTYRIKGTAAPGGTQQVSIMIHEPARPQANQIINEIQGQGNTQLLSSSDGVLHMIIDPANLERIAALDGVQAIETITPIMPYNDVIKEISGINSINAELQANSKLPLTGDGQVVALADTGVDTNHPAFKNKIAKQFWITGEKKDTGGHGSHVAGTILGSPMTSFDSKDCGGMAPKARICSHGGMFRDKRVQASDLFDQVYKLSDLNCRVHNNSWGAAYSQEEKDAADRGEITLRQFAYTIDNAEPVDQFAIDHPDFLILFAAGNDGLKTTVTGAQVGAYAAAKNVLTVGATFSNRPMSQRWHVDYTTENEQLFKQKNPKAFRRGKLAPFSSIGPCLNSQRTKPDVVAPGSAVLSARSRDFDPEELGQTLKGALWPPGVELDDKIIFMSGTSMATPAVSGYAALLREALARWQGTQQPSAPLMKALFINGTTPLPDVPREKQGFGEVDMVKVLRPVKTPVADITAGKAASGWMQDTMNRNRSTQLKVTKAVAPPAVSGKKIYIKVTLVYHDRPGDQIQNRMNLYVERGTGSNVARTNTAPTTPFDNVHQLILGPLTAGETLTIGAEALLIIGGAMPFGVVWDCFYV